MNVLSTSNLDADATDHFHFCSVGDLGALAESFAMETVGDGSRIRRPITDLNYLSETQTETKTEGPVMKKLVSFPLGDKGSVALTVEAGKLRLSASYIDRGDISLSGGYPVADLLDPVKKNFVDKLKGLIKGDWDDALIDKAWLEAIKAVSEEEAKA